MTIENLIAEYRVKFEKEEDHSRQWDLYNYLKCDIQELSWIVEPVIRPNQYGWPQTYREGVRDDEKYFSLVAQAKEALVIKTQSGPFDEFISALA